MEGALQYHNSLSRATCIIQQIISPQELIICNPINSRSFSPSLTIHFEFYTDEVYYYTSPHDPTQFQLLQEYNNRTLAKSFNLKLYPTEYMSYDMFYRIMQQNLMNNEVFENNHRHDLIHDMIGKIRKIVDDDKGRQKLKVFVGVTLLIDHWCLLKEQSLCLNGMAPAVSNLFLKKKKDECVICFEELNGKERELLGMPCSHLFHNECITKWLENGHCCPICRYEITAELDTQKEH